MKQSTPPPGANRLIFEKSPYLLQHAHNPVDWYPWGEEAFARARAEDKPIFLSIGYATCHWCHVMERESFEDPQVAGLLNQAFVCVKVDREERPDVDSVYMAFCHAMTGSGGWPLTIVMTPDRQPFFAATYLPRINRFGRLGMVELAPRLEEFWRTRRGETEQLTTQIVTALQQAQATTPGPQPTERSLRQAFTALAESFDRRHGGFGEAPKFPSPHNLLFLLRWWRREREPRALAMVEKTLQAMRAGGVYDQVGFGFHRYSTDRHWLAPHFEKMLYDQALLIMAYTETYQATGRRQYRDTAREICAYVLRDLTDPGGGFYSAEDADSEGEEGRFYVWTAAELQELLPPELHEVVVRAWDVRTGGNYLDEASGEATGANILHHVPALAEVASELYRSEDEVADLLEQARRILLEHRSRRVRPLRDDKILTDWNGLMISALAKLGAACDETGYVQRARRAADFLLQTLRTPSGGLWHRYREGEVAFEGYLDDYAFLAAGLLDLHQACFEPAYLQAALELTETMLERFWDLPDGGLFFTAAGAEVLPLRLKETFDGAIPAGNSVALLNLLRLGRLLGRPDLEARAADLLTALGSRINDLPAAHTFMLCGLDFALGPTAEVVLLGAPEAPDTLDLLRPIRQKLHPEVLVLVVPPGPAGEAVAALAPHVRELRPLDNRATAYLCRGQQCEPPTTDPETLAAKLEK